MIRLVRINGFYLEAVPEGFILMLNNRDVPGVVGNVGMLLGEAQDQHRRPAARPRSASAAWRCRWSTSTSASRHRSWTGSAQLPNIVSADLLEL